MFPTVRMRNCRQTNNGKWLHFELAANSSQEKAEFVALLTREIPATERSHSPSWTRRAEMADIWEIKLTDTNIEFLRRWLVDAPGYLDFMTAQPTLLGPRVG